MAFRPNYAELGRSEPLAPGSYLLRTRERRWYAPDARVEVESGRTARVEVVLQPATTRTFVMRVPKRDPSTRVHLRIATPDGATFSEHECVFRSKDRFVIDVLGLPPGRYRASALSPAGLACSTVFAVTILAEVEELELQLE